MERHCQKEKTPVVNRGFPLRFPFLGSAGDAAGIRWTDRRMQQKPTNNPQALQTNLSPVQLTLPGIAFAPRPVLEHGLVETHTWPLVSKGKFQGVVHASFRVHASVAWSFPSLELRSATAWPVVCLDCDGNGGHSRLILGSGLITKRSPRQQWRWH